LAAAPPPPGLPSSPKTLTKTTEAPASLLEQIRQGRSLRNVNIDQLRSEQKKLREQAAKLNNGKGLSLEETLRFALTSRMVAFEGEDEDEEGAEWD
jgi:hypothetical protein